LDPLFISSVAASGSIGYAGSRPHLSSAKRWRTLRLQSAWGKGGATGKVAE